MKRYVPILSSAEACRLPDKADLFPGGSLFLHPSFYLDSATVTELPLTQKVGASGM